MHAKPFITGKSHEHLLAHGKNVDKLKENLKKIKLPEGFKIELYAVVPDARYMAVAPSTNMLFVGTRKTTVWAVTDRNGDMTADEVKPFAPSIKFKNPNGVCWTKDGFLIVVESNRVLNFPAAEYFYEGPDVAVITAVQQGGLIPADEESFNHTGRTCKVADDGKGQYSVLVTELLNNLDSQTGAATAFRQKTSPLKHCLLDILPALKDRDDLAASCKLPSAPQSLQIERLMSQSAFVQCQCTLKR